MRLLLAAIWAASLAFAAPAAAQSSPTQADEEAAKAHFLAGSAYYEQANYTDAVKEFNEAHRLSQRPDLLYNISVCYERLSRWDEAIASLRQYLTERPEAPDRAVIESRIKNFEDRHAAEQRKPAQATAQAPPSSAPMVTTPPSRTRHVVSFVVGGIGAGLLLAAIGTGVAAQLAYDDLNKKCPNKVCDTGNQTLRDEQSSGKALALATDVLIGVGAAAVVAGTVMFILESRRPQQAHARLVPSNNGLAVHF
jgi:tetratricopeptide (TPR) repeat protein